MRGLPCVKGAVSRRLTEGSAKAFLSNRVLSKHPALSIPPSRLRRATSLYAREASSGGGAPSSGPGCARSTLSVGEGFLRRGTLYSSPSWTCRGPLHTRPGLCPVHPLPGEGFCFYSTPRRYRPLVQAPGSKLVGVRYSSRIRSTSRAFSVVKFSRMAQRPSLLRSFCRSSQ